MVPEQYVVKGGIEWEGDLKLTERVTWNSRSPCPVIKWRNTTVVHQPETIYQLPTYFLTYLLVHTSLPRTRVKPSLYFLWVTIKSHPSFHRRVNHRRKRLVSYRKKVDVTLPVTLNVLVVIFEFIGFRTPQFLIFSFRGHLWYTTGNPCEYSPSLPVIGPVNVFQNLLIILRSQWTSECRGTSFLTHTQDNSHS